MDASFIKKLYQAHLETLEVPSPEAVCKVIDGLLELLFPELSDQRFGSLREFERRFEGVQLEFFQILKTLGDSLDCDPQTLEDRFFEKLPRIHELLLLDASAISMGDPAAVSTTEVIRTYPGFFAVAVYRLAHELYRLKVPLIPRILTEHAHSKTGIDIHPGAEIGAHFCIDHGTGAVIGETVQIGKGVKIYQGVTLGALSVKKELAQTKRHPTIEDRVVIYSGATILGGQTVIGHDSIIGGNVWITKSVAPHSVIYYEGRKT